MGDLVVSLSTMFFWERLVQLLLGRNRVGKIGVGVEHKVLLGYHLNQDLKANSTIVWKGDL